MDIRITNPEATCIGQGILWGGQPDEFLEIIQTFFINYARAYRHEVTFSRCSKVAACHSSLFNPSPYWFPLLVVPFLFQIIEMLLALLARHLKKEYTVYSKFQNQSIKHCALYLPRIKRNKRSISNCSEQMIGQRIGIWRLL